MILKSKAKFEHILILAAVFWIRGETAPEKCYEDLFSYTGYIQSVNFPQLYESGRKCTWLISTTAVYRLQLTFEAFDLENHTSCEYDHVTIYDGPSVSNKILGKFCGNTLPKPLISSKNAMRIVFETDARMQGTGFKAFYTSAMCGANFHQETGSFEGPSFLSNYPGYKRCIWTIEVPNERQVSLTINSLQFSPFSNCSTEYLKILNGHENKTSENGILLATICKTEGMNEEHPLLNDIRASSNKMYVEFVSEAPVQGLRFSAVFKSEQCGGHYEQDEGQIMSENYPENYPENSDCLWTITVSEGYQVALDFSALKIWYTENCTSDYLEIRDGLNDTSPLIMDPLCGYQLPGLIRSSSNSMWIKFKSDSNYTAEGFLLNYGKDVDECENSNNGCQYLCANIVGSYKCMCYDGYILNDDRHTCSELNECNNATLHNCEQICLNTDGSYECACSNGYILNTDNRTCTDICQDSSIDAATQTADGSSYFFKGNFYFKMLERGYDKNAYPRKISDDWKGLEGNIDASFSDQYSTYFFKGKKYWKFIDNQMVSGFPRYISDDFIHARSPLDAAFYLNETREAFLLKGNSYWKFEIPRNMSVTRIMSSISSSFHFPGLPANVDAALSMETKRTYLFAGDKYIRFNPKNFEIDVTSPPYPRPISAWWFDCPDSS